MTSDPTRRFVLPRKFASPGRFRRLKLGVLLLALGVFTLAGAWFMLGSSRQEPAAGVPIRDLVALLSPGIRSMGLPGELNNPWSTAVLSDAHQSHARAVRIGVRNADLTLLASQRNRNARLAYYDRDSTALAVVAHNSARIESHASEMRQELRHWEEGVRAATLYREVEMRAARRATFGTELWRAQDLTLRYDPQFVVLGNWLGYARVAAVRNDTAFFRRPESMAIAAGAPRLTGLQEQERAALIRIHNLIQTNSAIDAATISAAIAQAIAALAIPPT